MSKYMILSGIGELSISHEIEKVFDADSLREAEETASEYLTGDGLPCAGPIRSFWLVEVTPVEGFKFTTQRLWAAHIMKLALLK